MDLLEERMRRPSHQGALEGAAIGEVGNPACGDVLRLYLRVEDRRIVAASFESFGSPYQLATASVLCDCVQGQGIQAARQRGPDCVLKRLPGLPERQQYLARLAVEALGLALDAAEGKGPVRHGTVERRTLVEDDEARAFVVACLQDGDLTTGEVEARARAAGILLPTSTAKTLSRMRSEGLIEVRMALRRKAFSWHLPQGDPGTAQAHQH